MIQEGMTAQSFFTNIHFFHDIESKFLDFRQFLSGYSMKFGNKFKNLFSKLEETEIQILTSSGISISICADW